MDLPRPRQLVRRLSFARTVAAGGYDVGSGTLTTVSKDVHVTLNEFGQFTTIGADGLTPDLDARVQALSAMADRRLADEFDMASHLYAAYPDISYDEVVGYSMGLFAGRVVEGRYRDNGSSGGFATWILTELLDRGDIDGVIHVKPTHSLNAPLFRYEISRTRAEVHAGSGSRYYPVELSAVLTDILKTSERYAVVAIPSIMMELRLLAMGDTRFTDRIAYTVGLICGHQKSTKYAESLAWQAGISPGQLRYFNFRKKIPGRPPWDYSMEMTGFIDGELVTIEKRQDELLGSDWAHGLFKAKFSDYTDDALNETADVAVGDAWLPEYDQTSEGTNVLIIRHPRIAQLVQDGIREGRLDLSPIDAATVVRSQRGLVHHTRDELGFRLARRDRAGQWRPRKRVPASSDIPLLRRRVQRIREDIAAKSHLLYREALERSDWEYFAVRIRQLIRRYDFTYRLIHWQTIVRRGPRSVAQALGVKLFGRR